MTPYLGSTPAFHTPRWFSPNRNELDPTRVWEVAKMYGDFLTAHTTREALVFGARMMPFNLSNQPISVNPPTLVVSSWSPKSPIVERYACASPPQAGEEKRKRRVDVVVDDALFAMNGSINGWVTISVYTVVDKLHVTLLAPVPRFHEEEVQKVHQGGRMRMMNMIKEGRSAAL